MATEEYFKIVKALGKKKYRDKHSLFLVEGVRGCEELITSKFQIDHLFYTRSGLTNTRINKLLGDVESQEIKFEEISSEKMNYIANTVTSQDIIAIAKIPGLLPEIDLLTTNYVLCFESISDPGNLGTIIRTASWFGIDAIVLSKGSADAYNPKVVRSSSGGIFKIPIISDVTLLDFVNKAREADFEIFATLPQSGKSIHKIEFPKKVILMFGSEADGLSASLISAADTTLSIPTKGSAESLNLAVSCGIILGVMDYRSQG